MNRLKLIFLLFYVCLVFIEAGLNPKPNNPSPTQQACPNNMFKCKSGRCIPQSWKCDGDSDCDDGSDEDECSKHESRCNPQEYECRGSTVGQNGYIFHLTQSASLFHHNCIPTSWKCDGEFDCPNKDDEENCGNFTCGNDQFKCTSNQDGNFASCIPNSWKCDGQADCANGEDEKDCKNEHKECDKNNEFQCHDGSCIYKNWQCDGDEDCLDGSDEINEKCQVYACDTKTKFKCKTVNFCIPLSWKCDGEADCIDRSDEMDCKSGFHPNKTHECHTHEFRCKSGAECISEDWKCDGDLDCSDGSDETDETCPKVKETCGKGESHCKNFPYNCIKNSDFCNGEEDCHDGYDEKVNYDGTKCIFPLVPEGKDCDSKTQYKCPGSPTQCVDYVDLCTNNHPCANETFCKENIYLCNATHHNCVVHKSKFNTDVYHCEPGFHVVDHANGICEDINECETVGICDHKCINLPGSFRCECYSGFKLTYTNKNDTSRSVFNIPTKCRAMGEAPILLLSNRAAIRQYDLNTNRYLKFIDKLDSAVAMDYWLKNSTIIWSDVAQEKIYMCNMTQNLHFPKMIDCVDDGNHVVLVEHNISTPDGLAVDWIHGLLFWTDTGLDTINVMDLHTKKRKVLINKDLDEPRAIAVDPSRGLIFWTDWGNQARIERASMDGNDRVTIVQGDNVRWPNGIALDILDERVYWADAKTKTIASVDYNGNDWRTILQSHAHIKHPFALAVFEEKLYWTDWDQEGVLVMNKFDGTEVKPLTSGVTGPMTVRVYHRAVQPEHPNKCEQHFCSDGAICLPKGHLDNQGKAKPEIGLPYTCNCIIGYKAGSDPTMCVLEHMIADAVDKEVGSKFSLAFLLMILIIAFFGIVAYVYTRNRPTRFSGLHFDNPIYRRTVEDLDPEMDGMPDTSLGPISAVGASAPFGGPHTDFATPKLVLSTPGIDFRDPTQYGYDQPPPSYDASQAVSSSTSTTTRA